MRRRIIGEGRRLERRDRFGVEVLWEEAEIPRPGPFPARAP